VAKIYEKLSNVYDLFWGKWSPDYVILIRETLSGKMPGKVSILDLACGTGSLAVELGKFGYNVFGIDCSPQMIQIAERKSFNLPNVNFEIDNMVVFKTAQKFDCVTCTFDSINYLLKLSHIRQLIGNIAEMLKPGGFFIFDSNTAKMFENQQKGEFKRELGGQVLLQKLNYDSVQRLSTTTFQFQDGSEEVHKQRPYDLEEITPILTEAGFSIVKTQSNLTGEPFVQQSERLICVAKR